MGRVPHLLAAQRWRLTRPSAWRPLQEALCWSAVISILEHHFHSPRGEGAVKWCHDVVMDGYSQSVLHVGHDEGEPL